MSITNPPSRLSPVAGPSMPSTFGLPNIANESEDGHDDDDGRSKRSDAPKRGYRACVHCRLRKAKCDLGDVNAPSEPPCSRCRREQRNCVFLPSKRRRKTSDAPPPAPISIPSVPPPASAPLNQWTPLQSANQTFQGWPDAVFRDPAPTFSYPELPQAAPRNADTSPMRQFPDFEPVSHATPASAESTSTAALSPASRQRRQNPDATRRIVVANFSNETDALEILADAATDGEERPGVRVRFQDYDLKSFILVEDGIVTEAELWSLTQLYFQNYHPVLPIVQTPRIPLNLEALAKFAAEDPFLLSCIIIVAAAHHNELPTRQVHDKVWAIVRETLADFTFGGVEASVGLVEGMLLLAEFLPREQKKTAPLLKGKSEGGLHGTENRRGWSMTGLAIRAAYGLQLDQAALETQPRTISQERARLVWTWCYLYDRTIGLRTGLAFWSRGPSICFSGYSHISQTGEAAARVNFPSMLSPTPAELYDEPSEGSGAGGDSASFIQALMELTQIMTNAHDTLYPNSGRTADLVRQGGYFRFLDSFRRALDSFQSVWQAKKWENQSLKELTWCTYEMVRLYISSFAFQAHVQRAWTRAEGTTSGMQLFPRGSATSPDALYIYASVDAANEILSICLRLSKLGALRYLPSRYLTNFVFGGVFALKAGYSGAVGRAENAKTRELVDKVCAALVLASPDREHPAARYGQMLRLLSKKLEQMSDQSAVPSRFPSPELQPDESWHNMMANPTFQSLPIAPMASGLAHTGMTPPQTGLEGLFDFEVDVNFNLDGFWDDFTLAEGGGFPFR